jgi:hypothetical protein
MEGTRLALKGNPALADAVLKLVTLLSHVQINFIIEFPLQLGDARGNGRDFRIHNAFRLLALCNPGFVIDFRQPPGLPPYFLG